MRNDSNPYQAPVEIADEPLPVVCSFCQSPKPDGDLVSSVDGRAWICGACARRATLVAEEGASEPFRVSSLAGLAAGVALMGAACVQQLRFREVAGSGSVSALIIGLLGTAVLGYVLLRRRGPRT